MFVYLSFLVTLFLLLLQYEHSNLLNSFVTTITETAIDVTVAIARRRLSPMSRRQQEQEQLNDSITNINLQHQIETMSMSKKKSITSRRGQLRQRPKEDDKCPMCLETFSQVSENQI